MIFSSNKPKIFPFKSTMAFFIALRIQFIYYFDKYKKIAYNI